MSEEAVPKSQEAQRASLWIGMAGEMQTVFTKLAESAKHAHAYLSAEEELRGRSEKAEVKKAAKEEAKAVKKAGKAGKPKREPSAYNLFMKTELPKVKLMDPTLDHKTAFTKAANNWKDAPENPGTSEGGAAKKKAEDDGNEKAAKKAKPAAAAPAAKETSSDSDSDSESS